MARIRYKLLTDQDSNPKTSKSAGLGYLTAVLHLAPAKLSGKEVCPFRTAGCTASCLNTAGRGGIRPADGSLNTIQAARIRRTRYFLEDRQAFLEDLAGDIARLQREAQRLDMRPAVRLNGTSDLPWERFGIDSAEGRNLMEIFPQVQFYDYTKWPLAKRSDLPRNYHLTYSRAETSGVNVFSALQNRRSVTVVFSTKKGEELPAEYCGLVVVDGDAHDLTFLHPAGSVIGLRAKGPARNDRSGFVVQV